MHPGFGRCARIGLRHRISCHDGADCGRQVAAAQDAKACQRMHSPVGGCITGHRTHAVVGGMQPHRALTPHIRRHILAHWRLAMARPSLPKDEHRFLHPLRGPSFPAKMSLYTYYIRNITILIHIYFRHPGTALPSLPSLPQNLRENDQNALRSVIHCVFLI
jgi:hypothetical protein